jgi:hypothetical protein
VGKVHSGCVLLDSLDSWYGTHEDMLSTVVPAHSLAGQLWNALASNANETGMITVQGATAAAAAAAAAARIGAVGDGSSSRQRGRGEAHSFQKPVLSLTQALAGLMGSGYLHGLDVALHQAGVALCQQLPVPWCCNNPGCRVMVGGSELQLVGGKGCVCGGCRVAR